MPPSSITWRRRAMAGRSRVAPEQPASSKRSPIVKAFADPVKPGVARLGGEVPARHELGFAGGELVPLVHGLAGVNGVADDRMGSRSQGKRAPGYTRTIGRGASGLAQVLQARGGFSAQSGTIRKPAAVLQPGAAAQRAGLAAAGAGDDRARAGRLRSCTDLPR